MKKIHILAVAVVLVAALLVVTPLSAAVFQKGTSFKSNLYAMNKTGGTSFKPMPIASIKPVTTSTPVPTATTSFRERYGSVLKAGANQKAVKPTTGWVNMTPLPTMTPTNLNNIWGGPVPGSDYWNVNLVGGSLPGTVPGDSDWGGTLTGGSATGNPGPMFG
jgi:hypothetical protein